MPVNIDGNEAGQRIFQNMRQFLAPMLFARSTSSTSTEDSPSTTPTQMGKKHASTTRSTLGSIPKPNHKTSRGATTIVGRLCDATSRGYRVDLRNFEVNTVIPSARPAKVEAAMPINAAHSVASVWPTSRGSVSRKAENTAVGDGKSHLGTSNILVTASMITSNKAARAVGRRSRHLRTVFRHLLLHGGRLVRLRHLDVRQH
ncbi:MAG: hypothetical protein BWY00_01676 [Firmicutes bacterium ADurb.Bin153]|nr:MAG: hypothetical protein BWY00_01676 [Firmicutes bacterium ADurb.Bin153]